MSYVQLMRRCAGAGGSTARQLPQAGRWKYSIARQSCSVYEWRWPGGQESFFPPSSLLREFKSSLVWEFKLFQFDLFQEFHKIHTTHEFQVLQSLPEDLLQIGHWVVGKIVLCIACFAYSLLLLVLVFPLLS